MPLPPPPAETENWGRYQSGEEAANMGEIGYSSALAGIGNRTDSTENLKHYPKADDDQGR
jgi:hypothetical protein